MSTAKPFRVSVSYVDWAHSSAAEDGHDLAIRLIDAPINAANTASPYILLDEPLLVAEIADVAELFIGGAETDLRAAKVRKRAVEWLQQRGLTVNQALGKKAKSV